MDRNIFNKIQFNKQVLAYAVRYGQSYSYSYGFSVVPMYPLVDRGKVLRNPT